MTPEEYKAMYARVYGCDPEENNSYLYQDEENAPYTVSEAERKRYADYSGAIAYMDNDYLLYDDLSDVDDEESFYEDFESVINDAGATFNSDTVCAIPGRSQELNQSIGALLTSELITFLSPLGTQYTGPPQPILQCPCFQLSAGSFFEPKADTKHECSSCPWCKGCVKFSTLRFLQLSGLTLRTPGRKPLYPCSASGDVYRYLHMSRLPPDALAFLVKKASNYALVTHHGSWFSDLMDDFYVHDFHLTRGKRKLYAITKTKAKFLRLEPRKQSASDKFPPSPAALADALSSISVRDEPLLHAAKTPCDTPTSVECVK